MESQFLYRLPTQLQSSAAHDGLSGPHKHYYCLHLYQAIVLLTITPKIFVKHYHMPYILNLHIS